VCVCVCVCARACVFAYVCVWMGVGERGMNRKQEGEAKPENPDLCLRWAGGGSRCVCMRACVYVCARACVCLDGWERGMKIRQ
jgi:hypothetical protein